MLMLSTLQWHS